MKIRKSIFQKAADAIAGIKTPLWLKNFFDNLEDLVLEILYDIGKETLNNMKAKIIELAEENISNEEKIAEFTKYVKIQLNLGHFKDHIINFIREMLILKMKNHSL